MTFLFSGDNYEARLQEALEDAPIGRSSSMTEDIFREQWEQEHSIIPGVTHITIENK